MVINQSGAVQQVNHYYPFGGLFGEGVQTSNQPYKYNGKELDRFQNLDLFDYGARHYDAALGRWFTVDPLAEKYHSISPYVYVANNPINLIDPDGKKIVFLIRNSSGEVTQLTYINGNFWHANGSRYNPGKESVSVTLYRTLAAYRKIESSENRALIHQLNTLENSSNIHYLEEGYKGEGSEVIPYKYGKTISETNKMVKNKEPIGTQTILDFSKESQDAFKESTGVKNSDFTTIVHEMQHQYDFDQGNMSGANEQGAKDPAEIRAVKNENKARKIENLPLRTKYNREEIDFKKLK